MIEEQEKDQEFEDAPYRSTEGSSPTFSPRRLTETDKQIIKFLLASKGRISSVELAKSLDIPLSTIQRRRKRLEGEFLEVAYSLRLDKLGWRKADLLISTSKGRAYAIGKELLTYNSVTRVCRSIGEHTIDLHAEVVFKNNVDLVHIIEWIKALDGVDGVMWTEPIELMGENAAAPPEILDQLKM
jgi:DNA-binding Lrp family transcriptional regulator